MWQIISNYIGVLIVGIGEILFGKIILMQNPKTNKFITILILLISTLAFTISSIYITGAFKSLLLCSLHIFEYKMLFNISYSKSIFLSILLFIVGIMADIIELTIMSSMMGVNEINEFAGSIYSNILFATLLTLITLVIKKPLKKIVNKEISNNVKIVVFSILTLGCIAIFFYVFINEFKSNGDYIQYLLIITVFLTILFSLIKETIKNSKLTHEYDKLLEFMKTYENEIEKQRILRHEVKNEFRTIKAKMCDQQENKEIIEYIDEIVNDKYEMDKEKYAKFGYLPPNGIKGLCYFKTQEAEDKGIKVNLNISKRIKNSTVYSLTTKEQRDFGRILGVFLDNAIEASLESKGKQLGIEAYVNSTQEFKMIITNTYDNKIDKSKIGIDKFSTKGKNRGHGLLLVKQLTEKNNIFECTKNIQEEIYIQTIIIKKI